MTDLVIRGNDADLEALRKEIERTVGADARLHPRTSAQDGELREPILIALTVALGGRTLTKAVADVIKRYLEHKETMANLSNKRLATENDYKLKLAIIDDDDNEVEIDVDQLDSLPAT